MAVLTAVEATAIDVMTRSAREYLRVSKGKGRTARSIRDQHTDNLDAEQEFGPWTWAEPYTDTGSASKFARKQRDDFEKLLADLKTGAFGKPGDVLVLWEISRLARETGRGVEIIDLCETRGYLIHITSHERPSYNPANYNDRHELISGIADAEREARRLSKRTLRGLNSAAREGRPQGQVPFGYARDYEVIDRRPRPVAQYPHREEGPLIAELFVRVAGADDNQLGDEDVPLLYVRPAEGDGCALPEPMYAIARDWEERGILSRDRMVDGEMVPGIPFSPQNLRSMLLRPAYAGLRKHNGKIVPIQWEGWTPVVSRQLFDRAQKILAEPSRRTYTGEHIRHALTMTLKCGVCGGGMVVVTRRKSGARDLVGYQCGPKGHVWVLKEETDRIIIGDLDRFDPETGQRLAPVLGTILKYLASPDRHAALRHRPKEGQEAQTIRGELARLNGELKVLEDEPAPKTARARIQRTKDIEELETDVAGLEAKLKKLTTPAPLAELLPNGPITDVVRWWRGTGVEKQRAIAARLLTPSLLGEVRIMPSPSRRPLPAAERIGWRREGPTDG
ncbi:recombinase family protein [Streptomyces sp. NBC_00996]|uniref:recombinase family protein n=1 Tax=Streptomyces sp. NBC_00996 TaxID=2903710 RepID=UPI00386A251B|nr:recombinase family protein [Streptomyces sp. NBC_00996]